MLAIYIRVSSDKQKDQYSLPIQKDSGINFAKTLNKEYKVYQDIWSGKDITRTGFQELISDIKNNEITDLHIHAFDRLSRNTRDALEIIEYLQKYKVNFYVNHTFYDVNDLNVQMILTIQYAVATNEVAKINLRTSEGKTREINTGNKALPNPFGYNWRYEEDGKRHWYINKEEAEAVKLAYKLFLKGSTVSDITRKFNTDGYTPKKKSKYFEVSTISKILRRIEYTGKTYNKAGEIIDSTKYEEIIPFETWKKVQEYYTPTNITKRTNSYYGVKHLSSALLYCGHCNAPYNYFTSEYHKENKKGKMRTYKRYFYMHKYYKIRETCKQSPKTVNNAFLDELFKCIYAYSMMNPKIVLEFYNRNNKNKDIDKIKQDIKRITNKIKDTEKEKDNLVKAVAIGGNIESLVSEIQSRENIIKELLQSKKDKEMSITERLNNEKNMHIKFSADKVNAFFDSEDLMFRRKELKSILKSAVIKDKIITITLITGFQFIFNLDDIPKELRYLKESVDNEFNMDLFYYMIKYNKVQKENG